MAICIDNYLPLGRHYRVLDLGSRNAHAKLPKHLDLLNRHDCEYLGIDLLDGPNVDVVMDKPYRFPVASRSVDVVLSGQVFEHVPFFWASMAEIARVLKPNGLAFVTAPSRGHVHNTQDCWRYYPDGFRAMAAFSGLRLHEAYTEFPPKVKGKNHHDFTRITPQAYWGDAVGVFQKPKNYPSLRMWIVREVMVGWANHVGGIENVPQPINLAKRQR